MASKVKTLAEINSVSALASHNKQLAKMEVSIEHLEKAVDRQHKMHNGSHP